MNINRKFTNSIRFILDECLPPIVRDNKYFMYPLYWISYKGKNINEVMNFKKNIYTYTKEQYEEFYRDLCSISRSRNTDINDACLDEIMRLIPKNTNTIIDVGCGNGYLVNLLKKRLPNANIHGCDFVKPDSLDHNSFTACDVTELPFHDESFDVSICAHTLEHILDIDAAIDELKRITKKRLIIIVPSQRSYFYTLDEHINFFTYKEQLSYILRVPIENCRKFNGDWLAYEDKI